MPRTVQNWIPIMGTLLQLGWPAVVSKIVEQLTSLTTVFFVSSFNDPSLLGSVSLGTMGQNVFGFSLGEGLAMAVGTLVSQSNGAGEHQLSGIYLQQAQSLGLWVCFPSMILLYFSPQAFQFIGIEEKTALDAGEFVRGTIPAMPLYFLHTTTRLYLRAMLVTRPEFYVSVLAASLHGMWCVLFLRALNWGAFGAGLTSSCTNLVQFTTLALYVYFAKPGSSGMSWRVLPSSSIFFAVCRGEMLDGAHGFKYYLSTALPSAVLLWSEWWVYEAMSLMAGLCGTIALAAHSAVCNLLLVLVMIPIAWSEATAAMVGNAIGKGDVDKVQDTILVACVTTLVFFVAVAGLVLIFKTFDAHLFSSDAGVVNITIRLTYILAPFLIVDSVQTVIEGALRGLGLQTPASHAKLFSMLGVRLVGSGLLAFAAKLGVIGIWWGSLLGMVATLLLYARILRNINIFEISTDVRQHMRVLLRQANI